MLDDSEFQSTESEYHLSIKNIDIQLTKSYKKRFVRTTVEFIKRICNVSCCMSKNRMKNRKWKILTGLHQNI